MSEDDKRHLGRIQLQRKLVSARELAEKESGPPTSRPPAPVSAARPSGPADDLLRALAERFGVPAIDLTRIVIPVEHLGVVPRPAAEALRLLPVLVRDEELIVAMEDPLDRKAIDELEFVTGKAVRPHAALPVDLVTARTAAYDALERGEAIYRAPFAPSARPAPPEAPPAPVSRPATLRPTTLPTTTPEPAPVSGRLPFFDSRRRED